MEAFLAFKFYDPKLQIDTRVTFALIPFVKINLFQCD